MKFGLHLDNATATDAAAVIDTWLNGVSIADAAGFSYVSVVDHQVPFPEIRTRQAVLFDAWQVLSAIAMETENVTLLTLVTNGSLVHPVKLAKQAATLDVLSRGRMLLGLGAGGYARDEAALGLTRATQSERYARLTECIELVQALWRGREVTYRGDHYALERYISSPVPVKSPRLLVAGKSERILQLVASRASACNFAFTGVQQLDALMRNLTTALEAADRPGENVEVTLLDRVFPGTSNEAALQAWRAAGAPVVNGHPGLIGSVEHLVEEISRLQHAGADTLFCMFNDMPALRLFAQEVLPALQSQSLIKSS